MFKKFVSFITIATLVVSLSACSSKIVSDTDKVSKINTSANPLEKLATVSSKNKADLHTTINDNNKPQDIETKVKMITNTDSYIVKDASLYDPPNNNKPLILGSIGYVDNIQNIAKKFGNPTGS